MAFILLVRHADIDLPRLPDNDDPDLNDLGRARAQALATCVSLSGVRRIYRSGARRTSQTLAPLAARLGLVPQVHTATADLIADLLEHVDDGVACVAGHSNTVPEIISALGADASLIRIGEADFANFFVVSGVGSASAQLLHLTYGAAPP